jgi:hypothetical protein
MKTLLTCPATLPFHILRAVVCPSHVLLSHVPFLYQSYPCYPVAPFLLRYPVTPPPLIMPFLRDPMLPLGEICLLAYLLFCLVYKSSFKTVTSLLACLCLPSEYPSCSVLVSCSAPYMVFCSRYDMSHLVLSLSLPSCHTPSVFLLF